MELLAQIAWKGTLILAAGAAANWILPRASAAFRHFLWTAVFAALLALPAMLLLAPKWSLPETKSPSVTVTVTSIGSSSTTPAETPARNPLPWIYAAGFLAVGVRFTTGALRTRRLIRSAQPSEHHRILRGVQVLESVDAPVPLVWGILRPAIVLPAHSRHWPHERLRVVLLHEALHVRRRDLLAQIVAQAACCLYWFHPLAWIAAREMRRLRERACDDAVLQRGVAAPAYAGMLVDLVRGLTVGVPAMAEASGFEVRVRALLDSKLNRAPLSRRAAAMVTLAAAVLLLPLVSLTSHAQGLRGSMVGIVTDPAGARVPGSEVRAVNLDGSNQETATANAAGEYSFASIPPGRYEIQFQSPGFAMLKTNVVVTAGAVARVDAALRLGEGMENVTVVGTGTPSAPPRAAGMNSAGRIPVGGNVQAFRLIRQPRPEYPLDLQQQGVTGTVMIRAIVGKDGSLLQPQVVNTDVNPRLAQAALDAVSKWIYDPTRLNGQPVETLVRITINFALNQ
jgi:TonB family protein